MNLIQVVLVAGFLASLVFYLAFFRTVLRDRLIAFGLFAVAVAAIVSPQITSEVAHVMGVGRGADLLIYVLAVCSVFVATLLYSKISRMERHLTEVVRQMAIDGAKEPPRGG